MEFGHGLRVKSRGRDRAFIGMNVSLDPESQLMIELPASWVLRYVSISVFFAVLILTLPLIGFMLKSSFGVGSELMSNFELAEALITDLSQEGLVTEIDKALVVGAGDVGDVGESLWFRSGNELHLAEESHLLDQSLIPDETYDFALVLSSLDAKSVDRVMKVGSIVAARLTTDYWSEFLENSNYKIMYIRNLEPAVVAARKIHHHNVDKRVVSLASRRLFEVMPEARVATSRVLPNSLLEQWRQALVSSRDFLSFKDGSGIACQFYRCYLARNLPFLSLSHQQMNGVEKEEHVATKARSEADEELPMNDLQLGTGTSWG
ncbi:hypothetical protein MLD38_023225 [Melastoma candidum]|uniref:Uncharacterized protein n=1 Tax=Melastoma candidum TaxID=119954 RepID=A0ACB9QPW3_9MYRT|nr:hypothetical protein MLD38_023225 [Melastoma candidum]